MESQPLITFHRLSKSYVNGSKKTVALDCTDFVLHEHEFASIIGPSGSGKTSFLYLAGLLDARYEGALSWANTDTSTLSAEHKTAIRLEHIGFVFQNANLLGDKTVLENVMFPLLTIGRDRDESRKKSLSLLARVGIVDKADSLPDHLSTGERQKCAIARALANDPRLIIADEPTGNLDTVATKEIIDLLLSINQEMGTALLIATHNPIVANSADSKYRIQDGRIRTIPALNIRQEIQKLFDDAHTCNEQEFKKLYTHTPSSAEKISRDNLIALRGLTNLLWLLIRERYQNPQDKYFLDRFHVLVHNHFLDAYFWHALLDNLFGIARGETFNENLFIEYKNVGLARTTDVLREKAQRAGFHRIAEAVNINADLYRAIIRGEYYAEDQLIRYRTKTGETESREFEDIKEAMMRYLECLEWCIAAYLARTPKPGAV